MPHPDAIVVRDLTKAYKNVSVLRGISFSVPRGTMLALLGPNGAGKTTTIRILSTLLRYDGGSASVNGWDVTADADEVRATIGLTGQFAAIDEYLTGRENLMMMGRLYHLARKECVRRTGELLEQFDLADAADRPAKTYSGGMRRRLDLAASLVAAPPILFLDEPTTGLDPRSRLQMWNVIEQLLRGGATILLTTQYLEEADKLADRIAVLDQGRIIAEGTANELKSRVGKDRLELVLTRDEDVRKTALLTQTPDTLVRAEERTVSIPVGGGITDIKKILDRLTGADVSVESLTLHKPTLDDVFLQLTGRAADPNPAPAPAVPPRP